MAVHGRYLYRFAAVLLISLFSISCSLKSEGSAFTSQLDVIDDLIAQGQNDDAVKLLKKLEKKAYSSFDSLGIYRRYVQLGENTAGEKLLKRAYKRNSKSPELCAVYAHLLMRTQRLEDALKIVPALEGTEYDSIRAEALLQEALLSAASADSFRAVSYIPLYISAYKRTHDTAWLKDGVSLQMAAGNYADAAALHPDKLFTPDDAYFWALILYDSGKFQEAADDLDTSDMLSRTQYGESAIPASMISAAALRSDLYITLGDADAAEKERQRIFSLIKDSKTEDDFTSTNADALSAMYVNSAYWSEKQKNIPEQYRLLSYTVQNWPNYVPGLIAYGRFAYTSSIPFVDDIYTQELREAGIKTLEMEQFDALPKVSVKDAVARMDGSLMYKKDPLLYVARLSLKYITDKDTDDRMKLADIWQILEKNQTGRDVYPSILMRYSVHLLISCGESDEAWGMYEKYMRNKYHFTAETSFWDQLVPLVGSIDAWECEYGAWFAASQKNLPASKRLYEYAVYESFKGGNYRISPFVSDQSAADLAMIYSSTGSIDKALDLYSIVSGLTDDLQLKAEILYRMACIQEKAGKNTEAQQSLEYSLAINPDNEKARIMLHQSEK